jgi:hypothetical protein
MKRIIKVSIGLIIRWNDNAVVREIHRFAIQAA